MGAATAARSMEALNALSAEDFCGAMSPLFDGAPRFLHRLAAARPFSDVEALFARAAEITVSMPEAERLELVNAHARIGAPPDAVSAMSFREQGYGSDAATTTTVARAQASLQARLEELNAAYEARFGFRFVVFVAGRPREAIPSIIESRLRSNRTAQLAAALRDVLAIARDRWSVAE